MPDLSQLPLPVAMLLIFFWYLRDRNSKLEKALHTLAKTLERNNIIFTAHLMTNPTIQNKEEIKSMLDDKPQ